MLIPMSFIYVVATPVVVPEASGGWEAGNWATLLVALIALGGVLWNTYRNDKGREAELEAADNRRRDDQAAADERHQASLKAAEQQRRDDIERAEQQRQQERDDHERERLEQLDREDRTRQRLAVAKCTATINEAAQRVTDAVVERHSQTGDAQALYFAKYASLQTFYTEATNALSQLDLELNNEAVSTMAEELWGAIVKRHERLTVAGNKGTDAMAEEVQDHQPLDPEIGQLIRAVQITARLNYVQYPELNAKYRAKWHEADDPEAGTA